MSAITMTRGGVAVHGHVEEGYGPVVDEFVEDSPVDALVATAQQREPPTRSEVPGECLIEAPATGVLRNGRSCNCTNPPRCGRNRSEVSAWPSTGVGIKAASSSHAERARGAAARWKRALAGPRLTMKTPTNQTVMGSAGER